MPHQLAAPGSTVRHTARRAEDLPPSVVVIEDEHSALDDDDEYRAALDRWLREVDSSEAIEFLISAADTLRAIREHDEA